MARKADLRIVDARHQAGRSQCKNPPKLTLKDEFKPKDENKEE